jgi:hypothetical protein
MIRRVAFVLAAVAVVMGGFFAGRELVRRPSPQPSPVPPAPAVAPGEPASSSVAAVQPVPGGPADEPAAFADDRSIGLKEAIREHASGPWVEGRGTVVRILRDDLRGRQHQRFVLRLASGGTLLLAHNTQLAGRAPVEEGTDVGFRGRYEWGARGGIVHWTHRDPRGGSGGWLEVAGRRYE